MRRHAATLPPTLPPLRDVRRQIDTMIAIFARPPLASACGHGHFFHLCLLRRRATSRARDWPRLTFSKAGADSYAKTFIPLLAQHAFYARYFSRKADRFKGVLCLGTAAAREMTQEAGRKRPACRDFRASSD